LRRRPDREKSAAMTRQPKLPLCSDFLALRGGTRARDAALGIAERAAGYAYDMDLEVWVEAVEEVETRSGATRYRSFFRRLQNA
jgi:hypothetical protein